MMFNFVIFLLSFIPYKFLNNKVVKYYIKTAVDDRIPLVPIFVWPYLSLFLMLLVGIIVSFLHNKYEFLFAISIANLIAGTIWTFVPNGCKRPKINGKSISNKLLRFIYIHDGDRNAFPSGHVYLSIVSTWFLMMSLPEYSIALIAWGLLVSISILFTKQHYFIDLPAGIVVAVVSIFIVLSS